MANERSRKKLHPMAQIHKQTYGQTDDHGDSMTEFAQGGLFSEKSRFKQNIYIYRVAFYQCPIA